MENISSPRSHTPDMLTQLCKGIDAKIEEHSSNQSIIDQLALSSMLVLTSSLEQAEELNKNLYFKKYWHTVTGDSLRDFNPLAQHIRLLEFVADHVLERLKQKDLIKHHTHTFLVTTHNSISQAKGSRFVDEMQQYLDGVALLLKQDVPSLQKQEFSPLLKEWSSETDIKELKGVPYTDLNSIEKIICFANDFLHLFNANPSSKDIFDAMSVLYSIKVPINDSITYSDFLKEIINNTSLIEKLSQGVPHKNLKRFYPPILPLFKAIKKIMILRTGQRYLINCLDDYLKSINQSVSEEEIILIYINGYLKERGFIDPHSSIKYIDLFIELVVELNILSLGNETQSSYEEIDDTSFSAIVDSQLRIGNYVQFGSFNNQKIIWLIVDIQHDKYVLLTKDMIFKAEFSKLKGELGPGLREWSGCIIRKYLNGELGFLHEFTQEETESILETRTDYVKDKHIYVENVAKCVANYDDSFKRSCEDRVFLLSVKEVKHLLYDQKLPHSIDEKYFLRDSSYEKQIIRVVEPNGAIGKVGFDRPAGIRPAISIEKIFFNHGDGSLDNPFRLE